MHKFSIGQAVQYRPEPSLSNAAPGTYMVIKLLPQRDGEFWYHIHTTNETHVRTAMESQLRCV